ncbi:MAG: hypothetical protein ACPGJV_10605 [Bacteriovoracaceae bacterium]
MNKAKIHLFFIPGLNQNPESFSLLAKFLQESLFQKDIETDFSIYEYREDLELSKRLHDLKNRISEIQNQGHEVIPIGFSLGSLLLSLAQSKQHLNFKKSIYLSPAFFIPKHSYVPKYLFKALPLKSLVSFQSPEYANKRFTSRSLYQNLYDGLSEFDPDQLLSLSHAKLIVVSPKDELVDSKKMKKAFLGKENIEVVPFSFKPKIYPYSRHLLFCPKNMSEEAFENLLRTVGKFLIRESN